MVAAAPISEVLVPLDGSTFSERALPCGRWIADRAGAPLRLLHVRQGVDAGVESYLAGLAARYGAASWRVDPLGEPSDEIGAYLGHGDGVVGCLSTHGRDRSAALLGSVARRVVDEVQAPVVLVGPSAAPPSSANT